MNLIVSETLRAWQLQGRKFALVDKLPAKSFAKGHPPDAINIVSDDILQRAPEHLPDKNALITTVKVCPSTHIHLLLRLDKKPRAGLVTSIPDTGHGSTSIWETSGLCDGTESGWRWEWSAS